MLAKDEPTDPVEAPVETTDPGVKQANQHIGVAGELVLPDVVPIVNTRHASRVMLWFNEQWIQLHYLMRGLAGTGVEWYLFFVGVGEHNKKLSIVLLVFLAVTIEEKYSDQPFFTNAVKYLMHAVDPEAAEIIFKEREVAHDPIGKAASMATEDATKAYMESAEYRVLKTDIEADVSFQIRRQAYLSAGMKDDVVLLDQEIAAVREERAERKRSKEEGGKEPVGEPVDESSHIQGRGLERPADEDGTGGQMTDGQPEDQIEEEPAKEEPAKGDGKAERRKRLPDPPPLPFELPKGLPGQ